ncbi:hypothetical protein IAT38_001082 [Cryptococcus sp. DSM 104549]
MHVPCSPLYQLPPPPSPLPPQVLNPPPLSTFRPGPSGIPQNLVDAHRDLTAVQRRKKRKEGREHVRALEVMVAELEDAAEGGCDASDGGDDGAIGQGGGKMYNEKGSGPNQEGKEQERKEEVIEQAKGLGREVPRSEPAQQQEQQSEQEQEAPTEETGSEDELDLLRPRTDLTPELSRHPRPVSTPRLTPPLHFVLGSDSILLETTSGTSDGHRLI